MAEVRNLLENGSDTKNTNDGNIRESDVPGIQESISAGTSEMGRPVGQQDEAQKTEEGGRSGRKRLTDVVSGKEALHIADGQRLSSLGGASATEKLLGLDMRPTMLGALVAPPGNNDFLRHLSPTKRRTIMRNMLSRQRNRMRKLATFLRDERDQMNLENADSLEESFSEAVSGSVDMETADLMRAIDELGKSARMLDVLDELLAMQDHTISQIGTFSQG